MNENENLETVTDDTPASDTVDTSDTDTEISDVVVDIGSGDSTDNTVVDVSPSASETSVPATEAYTVYQVYSDDATADALRAIDAKLSCVIFLIAFIWASHHIKNAVRSFTGRNIDK
jgi:hypothetical protein